MHTVAVLAGAVTLTLRPGAHTVEVQWRKWGEGSWRIVPSFGSGFSFGRSVVVTASHHALTATQPLSDAMIRGNAALVASGSNSSTGWSDIAGSVSTFTVKDQSRVVFKYAVNLAQYGNPNMDSWTWKRWSSISTRLIVDGQEYSHTAVSAHEGASHST